MFRSHDLRNVRRDFDRANLHEENAGTDPFLLFDRWLKESLETKIPEPTAMTLATNDENGQPTARIMLLKDVDQNGFIFFTNYLSRKGRGLEDESNRLGALLFFWIEMERQVRIEGEIEKISSIESDEYFESRPYESKIGAHASMQSEPIPDRVSLERRFEELKSRYPEGSDVPRPAHWGGYRLVPKSFEFWQGRVSRLHDRISFHSTVTISEAGAVKSWQRVRLSP